MDLQTFLQNYAWIIGGIAPFLQGFLNQAVEGELRFWRFRISESEQRTAISFMLAVLFALGIVSLNGQWDWKNLGASFAAVYVASQTIYYGYFRRQIKKKETE